MKALYFLKYFSLLAGIFVVAACSDEDLEKPNGVKITFQATSMLKSSADSLFLEEAYIGIDNIDLKRAGESDSATIEKIIYAGPYVVDLLKSTVSPAIRWIFAEPGTYSEIEIKTHKALSGGKSIVLKGTFIPADGSGDIPFELITGRDYTLTIENRSGIQVREGEIVDLLVVFDLSELFLGIDMNSVNIDENGILVISEEYDAENVALLVNQFESFSSFGLNDGSFKGNWPDEGPGNNDPEENEGTGEADEDDSDQDGADGNSDDDNSGEDNGSETDESGDSSDEGEIGSEPESDQDDSGSNGGGVTDEDEDGEGSGEDSSNDNQDNEDDNPDGEGDDEEDDPQTDDGNEDDDNLDDEGDDYSDDSDEDDDNDDDDKDDKKDKNKGKGNSGGKKN